jgi:hypothetical protein
VLTAVPGIGSAKPLDRPVDGMGQDATVWTIIQRAAQLFSSISGGAGKSRDGSGSDGGTKDNKGEFGGWSGGGSAIRRGSSGGIDGSRIRGVGGGGEGEGEERHLALLSRGHRGLLQLLSERICSDSMMQRCRAAVLSLHETLLPPAPKSGNKRISVSEDVLLHAEQRMAAVVDRAMEVLNPKPYLSFPDLMEEVEGEGEGDGDGDLEKRSS